MMGIKDFRQGVLLFPELFVKPVGAQQGLGQHGGFVFYGN